MTYSLPIRLFLAMMIGVLLMSCSEKTNAGEIVPELREQNKVFLTVGSTDFLIPAPYLNRLKVKVKPGYRGQSKGFTLFALLPEMEHITPENRAQFDVWGHGKKIGIRVSEVSFSIPERLANFVRNRKLSVDLERFGETGLHELPQDVYMKKSGQKRYLYNEREFGPALLTRDLPGSGPSPGCQLDWDYRPGLGIDARFSASFFEQRHEVLKKIRALLDGFVADAKAYNASDK